LRESEEWLFTTLRSVGDALIATDKDKVVTFVNPVAEELTGWDHEEALGKPVESIFHIINEQSRERCESPVEKVLRTGEMVGLANNTVLVSRDGTERIISDCGAPILEKDGSIIGVVLVFRDVTEKKRVEDLIRNQNEFLNNLLESLTHPFYVIDANDYTVKMANTSANFGPLTEESTCYKLTHNVDKPCDGKEHPCTIKEIKKTGKPVILEHTHYDFDGKTRIYEIHGYPIFDMNGDIVQAIEYTIDVSETKRLEDQFLQAQKMESVGRLAGGIAHDFNNMLSAILGYSELALTHLTDNDPVRNYIDTIMEAGRKAESLTRQLLAFSRKQVLEMKVVSINSIVENMAKILHRVIGEDITLELNLRHSVRNVKADTSQLEQILMNLVVNARDAMVCGGILTIETENVEFDDEYVRNHEGAKKGLYVLLAVTDTGKGMNRDVQERIFEPFFSTKGGKGTGLGLSTVYGIIQQHKGYIYVYSEPDMGTTFKIYLPVTGEAEKEVHLEDDKENLRGTETIMVVDDEPSIRKLVKDTLQPFGYRILEASCGEEALQVSETTEGAIDLLLTDVIMPEMNGHELSNIIASKRPSIKVIYTSGYTDDTIMHHGLIRSGVTFLQKPVTPKKLASKLRKVLDEKG
jgi:PAS domain S-box-containing protein